MKKTNILFLALVFSLVSSFGVYSYFYEENPLNKYRTRENIELLTSEYESGKDFLKELKTEEEVVDWLRIGKINKEISKEFGELEKLSEEDYRNKLNEYMLKYPIEEFYAGKEKQLSLGIEMLEKKDSLEEIEKVQEKFDKLSFDDKYFVLNYIRHKNISKMKFDKKFLVMNLIVDEVLKDYKEKGIFIGDVSDEEFSEELLNKVKKTGYNFKDLENPITTFFCSHENYPSSISQYGLNPLLPKKPISYRSVQTSLVEVPCDVEFKFNHTYKSNTRISGRTADLANLISDYGNKLSARTDGQNTMVVIGAKRFSYGLFADNIKENLNIFDI